MTETNKSAEIDLMELARYVWSKRRFIIKIALIGFAAGVIIALSIPREYTTVVKVAPESSKSSKMNQMSGLAMMAGIDMQTGSEDAIGISLYPDIVSSTPFVSMISRIPVKGSKMETPQSLYSYMEKGQKRPWFGYFLGIPSKIISMVSTSKKDTSGDGILDIYKLTLKEAGIFNSIRNRISTELDKKTRVINIKVTMQDPEISAVIADSVVKSLEKFIILYRTQKAKKDYDFNVKLYEEAKEKYFQAQSAYARYEDNNQRVIKQSVNVERTRLMNEQNMAFEFYSTMAQQMKMSQIKVQELTPVLTIIEPARVPVMKSNMSFSNLVLMFTFLAGFIAVAIVVVKHLLADNTNS